MPNLARRREVDLRAPRLESEISDPQVTAELLRRKGRVAMCTHCGHAFEEESKTCPRCDRKDGMGFVRPIPEKHQDEAFRGALRRAQARIAR